MYVMCYIIFCTNDFVIYLIKHINIIAEPFVLSRLLVRGGTLCYIFPIKSAQKKKLHNRTSRFVWGPNVFFKSMFSGLKFDTRLV